jgi:hypothetical protein
MGTHLTSFHLLSLIRLPFSYVRDILRSVPEEVDDVLVEPDGEWHTADAAYGAPTWMEQHPQAPDSKPPQALTRQMELAGKGNSQVWDLEDSESDGEGFVKREVLDSKMAFSSSPPTTAPGAAPRMNSQDVGNVIDLTLDSDDEDQPPAPPPPQPSLSQSQSQSQPQSQRGRAALPVQRDDRSPLQVQRHRRVETTPLPVLQPLPPSGPPLRMSTGPPSAMPPPQPRTGSMLGKRRNRDSDDDPRYRSPDERDYDREERDYLYTHKAPRRENEERSPPRPIYSPPSRALPAMTSERRTNGAPSNGYHNPPNPNPSSSSSAFPHAHARPAPNLPPIQPWSSSTYGYGRPFARSPESSQSPTLPSPPYYNNSPPARPSNENYRVASPLRTGSGGGYNRRWDQSQRLWD